MMSKGLATRLRQTGVLLVAVGGSWMAPVAHSAITDQILDQVETFSSNKVLRLKEDPTRFVGLAAAPQGPLRACQTSNVNGLFCLDGQVIKHWPAVAEHTLDVSPIPELGNNLFSCTDASLGLSTTGLACTSMTVDSSGNVWLAGRKPGGTTSSIIKVAKIVDGVCPLDNPSNFTGQSGDFSADYCHSEFFSRQSPVILDLSPVEGELVVPSGFLKKGILAVENRTKVVLFPFDKSTPLEWADWGLALGQQVSSATILQRQETFPDVLRTHVLIITNTGAVRSREGTKSSAYVFPVLNADTDDQPLSRGARCEPGVNTLNIFQIRASETAGRFLVTNRNYCKLFAIEPAYNTANDLIGFFPLASAVLQTGSVTPSVTLFPPDGLSVSPGVSINLAQCSGQFGCTFLGDSDDGNEYPAARMYGVTIEGTESGLMVFKLENIPDCRYTKNPIPAECSSDTIVPVAGSTAPQRQYLNVTPLLPPNVTDLFDGSGAKPFGLPPLLISPRYRAQASEAYRFQALFGVADPNIQFRKTFTVEFDIGDFNLAGSSLGCGVQQTPSPLPFNRWDIVTVVSERFSSVGGPTGRVVDSLSGAAAEHVDTMVNKGCYNPTPSAGSRWSMYSYNLELAEDKVVNGSYVYSPAIAYLSNLVLSLHTDLGAAQQKLACANVDAVGNAPLVPSAAPPLTSATCATLYTQWKNAQDKLKKCAAAAQNPKNSAPNQNCNAFVTQFDTYKAMVEALLPNGIDPANRVGELWSRTDVIKYVYSHFVKAAQIGPTAANAQ